MAPSRRPSAPVDPTAPRWKSGEVFRPGADGHSFVRHRRTPKAATWCGLAAAECVPDLPKDADVFTCWDCLRS